MICSQFIRTSLLASRYSGTLYGPEFGAWPLDHGLSLPRNFLRIILAANPRR